MELSRVLRSVAGTALIVAAFSLPAKAVPVDMTPCLNNAACVTPVTTAGASFSDNNLGNFTDFFVFSLAGPASVSTSASATNAFSDISSFLMRLLNGAGLAGSEVTHSVGSTPLPSGDQAIGLLATLGPGTYTLELSGNGNGTSSYGGTLDIRAVPLPAAALLFGSGLIGLVALGRRKKTQKSKG